MSDDFVKAIEPVRNQYVEGYATWLGEQARQHPEGHAEHVYAIQAQTNFARKLCRVDFAVRNGDNAPRLDYVPKSMLGFQPMQGDVDGVLVQLQPFRWDNAVVEIPGAIWDKDRVIEWFNRWFGFVDGMPTVTARDKPGNVIHICAWVEPGMLRIDFGSAEAQAIAELLPIAAASGASEFSIRDVSGLTAPGSGQPAPGQVV